MSTERAQKIKLEVTNKKLTIDREEFENMKADWEEQLWLARWDSEQVS